MHLQGVKLGDQQVLCVWEHRKHSHYSLVTVVTVVRKHVLKSVDVEGEEVDAQSNNEIRQMTQKTHTCAFKQLRVDIETRVKVGNEDRVI